MSHCLHHCGTTFVRCASGAAGKRATRGSLLLPRVAQLVQACTTSDVGMFTFTSSYTLNMLERYGRTTATRRASNGPSSGRVSPRSQRSSRGVRNCLCQAPLPRRCHAAALVSSRTRMRMNAVEYSRACKASLPCQSRAAKAQRAFGASESSSSAAVSAPASAPPPPPPYAF